jgi:hypothetical protein
VYETFVIEGETRVYMAQERLRWKWSKPANLTVNGPVKFAAEKRKLFVIDDEGKGHEMEIVKQVLKPTRRPRCHNSANPSGKYGVWSSVLAAATPPCIVIISKNFVAL